MPIYDFECGKCGKVCESIVDANKTYTMCPHCGSDAQKIFTGTRFIPFKPYTEYNLGDTPIEITSKRHLESELTKRGLAMDNRPVGLKPFKTKRSELKKKAEKAREFLNAT